MKIIRRTFSALICGILLTGQSANTEAPEPPSIVEIDFSKKFSCSLLFDSKASEVLLSRPIDRDHRWVSTQDGPLGNRTDRYAKCSVIGGTIYRCDWGEGEYIEFDLDSAQWVYISVKKFNYVLSGFFREGLLTQVTPISCAFIVEEFNK